MNFGFAAFVLGRLCFAYVALLVLPLGAAMVVDKSYILTFAGSMVVPLLLGTILYWHGRMYERRLQVKDAVFVVGAGWLSICVLGMLPYVIGMPQLSLVSCFFESTSMWTTTGATTIADLTALPVCFTVYRTLGHWCGAVGVILIFSLLMPKVRSGVDFILGAEMPGRGVERTMPTVKASVLVILTIFVVMNVAAVLLFLTGGLGLWESVNMAMATVATGGLSFFRNGVVQMPNHFLQLVCLIFMMLGAVNFTLWFKLWHRDWQGLKEDVEHRYFLGILVIAGLVVAVNMWLQGTHGFAGSLLRGFLMCISCATTTGMVFDDINAWSGFGQLVLILLMLVGGCSASAAGGIKIIRWMIVVKVLVAGLRRLLHPNMVTQITYGNRVLDENMVEGVVRFFFLYFSMFIIFALAVAFGGVPVLDSFSLTASCMSSTGCAFGEVGRQGFGILNNWSKLMAALAMLFGRLEFITLLALLRPEFWTKEQ